MNEQLYRNLLNDLKRTEIKYYLDKDPFVVTKIIEITTYVLKYKILPTKKVCFQCENIGVIDWIEKTKTYEEPLYRDLNEFLSQYKMKTTGENIWKLKFQEYKAFVIEHQRKPKVYEKSFFDGTDMCKWHYTQIENLVNKKNSCLPLNEEQKACLKNLDEILLKFKESNESKKHNLTNIKRLRELYSFLLEHEYLGYLNKYRFSDGMIMEKFYKKVINKEIILTEKEQVLFNRILGLSIRLKKDGKLGEIKYIGKHKDGCKSKLKISSIKRSHFSNKLKLEKKGFILKEMSLGCCMYYLRKILNIKREEMASIFGLKKSSYIQTEMNSCTFTFFRKMQYICFIKREDIQDELLEKIMERMKLSFCCENELNYYLVQLSAMFSLNNAYGRELAFQFFKKYKIERSNIKNKMYNLNKKIEIYKELEELEENETIFDDERQVIIKLKCILKKDILADKTPKEIINKTNIKLGIKCVDIHSVYSMSLEEAFRLLEFYEMHKMNQNLDIEQLRYMNQCCELLSCVLHPGKSLSFEVFRIKEILCLNTQILGDLFGVERHYLYYFISSDEKIVKIYDKIVNSLDKFDQYGNALDIERFKNCFLESYKKL